MRLEKIKLSGFKSFVDSTNIIFPGRLIGIVGPNGCGKSNVLDAVRWVMGENSVRQLRGDSLTDVIFNGSKNRKPVSRAMIELIFDNHDASIGGEYAQYSQISIRRVIDREGQSSYFLNNVRCRRRDIAGLFFGTGLGSNGYAMIEQGMISRLIEAKPEELRGYIEEAAGISRYKERRKETENRIKHTQENMLRINDLEEELNKQIEHLKHQAKTAERYKKLKEQERLMKARLLVVRWLKLNEEVSQLQVSIEQSKNLLESYHAELQEINTNIEKQRIVQVEGQDAFYAIQNRYQALNADIARIEQAIDHQNQKKQQLTFDLNQVIENLQKTECTLKQDETSIVTLTKTIEDLQPQFEKINQNLQISDQILSTIEQSIRCWQNEWDDFHQKASCVLQTVQVQQTRIEHLKQQSLQFDQQLEKIENEYRGLNIQQLHEELLQLNDQMEKVVLIIQLQEKKASVNLNSINKQRKCHTQYEMELNELYQRLHIARERHMSLQVLQRNALGETQEELTAWLRQHQLHDKPKLVKDLSVESGWEVAVETVLQPYLNAICVDGLHHVVQALHSLDQGSVTLFDVCSDVVESSCGDKAPVLSAKIKSSKWIGHLLEKIYIAESITEALSLWKTLNSHESVVTKDGIWI